MQVGDPGAMARISAAFLWGVFGSRAQAVPLVRIAGQVIYAIVANSRQLYAARARQLESRPAAPERHKPAEQHRQRRGAERSNHWV
jgi:hypothetical protein